MLTFDSFCCGNNNQSSNKFHLKFILYLSIFVSLSLKILCILVYVLEHSV